MLLMDCYVRNQFCLNQMQQASVLTLAWSYYIAIILHAYHEASVDCEHASTLFHDDD